MSGDYQVTLKVRNGRILSRIADLGFDSLAAFCRTHEIQL